jgi:DNA-binding NarL/FixJ family response regulator
MKTIVIIDDSPVVLRVSKKALEGAGYQVIALDDPGDFHPTPDQAPDLILVDINMPQFYGDDVVAYFKEEWPQGAPIYLFSNVPEQELKSRTEACGAEGYISKEWGVKALVSTVESIIGKGTA